MVHGIRGYLASYQSAIDHIASLLYLWLTVPELWINQPGICQEGENSVHLYLMMMRMIW